jgi:hypothetical protein
MSKKDEPEVTTVVDDSLEIEARVNKILYKERSDHRY